MRQMSDKTLNWLRAWLPALNLIVVGIMVPWGAWVTSSIYNIQRTVFTHTEGSVMSQRVSVNEKEIAVIHAHVGSIRSQLDRMEQASETRWLRIESILRDLDRADRARAAESRSN